MCEGSKIELDAGILVIPVEDEGDIVAEVVEMSEDIFDRVVVVAGVVGQDEFEVGAGELVGIFVKNCGEDESENIHSYNGDILFL